MSCERCLYGAKCPLLNKQECPINKLWKRAEEAEAIIAEAERIIKEGVKYDN